MPLQKKPLLVKTEQSKYWHFRKFRQDGIITTKCGRKFPVKDVTTISWPKHIHRGSPELCGTCTGLKYNVGKLREKGFFD